MNLRWDIDLADSTEETAGAFEAGGYKSAVLDYLKQNDPSFCGDASGMTVHDGLARIRELIVLKRNRT